MHSIEIFQLLSVDRVSFEYSSSYKRYTIRYEIQYLTKFVKENKKRGSKTGHNVLDREGKSERRGIVGWSSP